MKIYYFELMFKTFGFIMKWLMIIIGIVYFILMFKIIIDIGLILLNN